MQVLHGFTWFYMFLPVNSIQYAGAMTFGPESASSIRYAETRWDSAGWMIHIDSRFQHILKSKSNYGQVLNIQVPVALPWPTMSRQGLRKARAEALKPKATELCHLWSLCWEGLLLQNIAEFDNVKNIWTLSLDLSCCTFLDSLANSN